MGFLQKNWKFLAAIGGVVLVGQALRLRKQVDIANKVVLITGSSRGLGLALAEEFAHNGAKLVLCARDEQELEQARQRFTTSQVITIPCDVSDPAQVQRTVEKATAHFGRVDILVNNAGVISAGPWQTLTREDFEESMNIMFWGTYNMTMAVLPQMKQRRSGSIVNITSIGGKVSVPHLLAYSSAKFAAVGFSEGLYAELAPYGIHVTTVAPGLMRTGSHVNAVIKGEKHRVEYSLFTLLDTLPVSSISVRRAARQIVTATRHASPELIITIQAQLFARLHGAFPELTNNLLALTNRFLPSGEDAGTARYTGKESETSLTQSPITALGQKAARDLNELP